MVSVRTSIFRETSTPFLPDARKPTTPSFVKSRFSETIHWLFVVLTTALIMFDWG